LLWRPYVKLDRLLHIPAKDAQGMGARRRRRSTRRRGPWKARNGRLIMHLRKASSHIANHHRA